MPKEIEGMKLKAIGYIWQCQKCGHEQLELYAVDHVRCQECFKSYEVSEHKHKLD